MAITLTDINKTLIDQKATFDRTDENIAKMSSNLSSFLNMFKSDKLKNRESEIEGKARLKRQSGSGSKSGSSGTGLFAGLGIGAILSSLIPSLSTIILGSVGALLASVDETFNDISRTVYATTSKFTKGIRTKIGNLFGEKGAIGKALQSFKASILGLMYLDADGKPLPGRFKFDKLGNITAFDKAGPVAKFFRFLNSTFNTISKFVTSPLMKGVGKLLPVLGSVLRVLFKPIGFIFTAYDTIKGAVDGYERAGGGFAGIFGAGIGGVGGLLKSLVGAPLNLLRRGIAYLAGLFGFEKAEAWINENLDFEKMISDLINPIIDFIAAPIESVKKAIDKLTQSDAYQALFGDKIELTEGQEAEQELKRTPGIKAALEASVNPMGGQDYSGAKSYIESEFSGRRQEQLLQLLDQMQKNSMSKGTMGAFGSLFKNFGKGTPAVLHGEEAVIPKNSEMGGFLGKMMDASAPMAQFAHGEGQKMKAKENAMRAAGASDMEIAQSMMGDMGGMMAGLKGAASAGGLDKLSVPKMPKLDIKNQMGNMFGSMVKENEEAKRAQTQQPAPVIISDNSNKSSSSSNTAMPVMSTPYDFDDPFVAGLRA